jgi:hypothetical protein
MNTKSLVAILGGVLAIICGEALKLGLKNWADLSNFTYWMGCGMQIAGLCAAYTGGLYQDKPGGADAAVTAQKTATTAQQDATSAVNKLLPLGLLVLILPGLVGCSPKTVTFDTSTTGTMYQAEQAMKDLGKVRDFSTDLLDQRVISVQQFRWTVQLIDVADAALEKAGSGWKDVLSTGAWEAALKEIPELGPMPETWQGAVRQAWNVVKLKVPVLTTSAGWSVVAGAVDGGLAKLGG